MTGVSFRMRIPDLRPERDAEGGAGTEHAQAAQDGRTVRRSDGNDVREEKSRQPDAREARESAEGGAQKEKSREIGVQVVRSGRRTVSLEVTGDGRVLIRAPYRSPDEELIRFAESKRNWIAAHLKQADERQRNRAREASGRRPLTDQEILALARKAAEIIPPKVERYARIMGVSYGRITIRHQKTRWGSCSSRGNLNFNCMLAAVPEAELDYVIVHELAHRRQMNHSPAFWAEVEKVLPDFRKRKAWFREHEWEYI